ncbi:hypothetical protein E2C01_070000 [Portunus trituberculatus]|uniref:Uncharacterized protein n=1 Tax=Portunus trituberculatus TaxID=210409 RepID=A0A5B7I128_PORTR|nr:hypothetical protein [Portunus trituberculatus]
MEGKGVDGWRKGAGKGMKDRKVRIASHDSPMIPQGASNVPSASGMPNEVTAGQKIPVTSIE